MIVISIYFKDEFGNEGWRINKINRSCCVFIISLGLI
jgi:hypothetical protein